MGTNYEYTAENFEEILSRLQADETELLSNNNCNNSENGLADFDFSELENLGLEGLNSNTSRSCPDLENNIGTLEVASNCNSGCGVVSCRQCYEKGLRNGLEQGFTRGYQKGYCKGRDAGLREGFNAGLERGLSRAEELARAAYEKGFKCGYQKGYSAGYQKGFQDGCRIGFQRGARAGFNNGFRSGYEKAVRDIIRCANANAANNGVRTRCNNNSNSNGSWRNC